MEKSNKAKIIDTIKDKVLTGEADFSPENVIKAHSGMNLIISQEMIDASADELEQSMEFTHKDKRYKYELTLKVKPI
jgi:hypothetical protein